MSASSQGILALIISKGEHEWVSCQSIRRNLILSYQKAFPYRDIRTFETTDDLSEMWLTAKKIRELEPQEIVFIDHSPHPKHLLFALPELWNREIMPALYFHIYGDFTLHTRSWSEVEPLLFNLPITFICASHRQLNLIQKFLKPYPNSVELCPFPIDTDIFHYDDAKRKKWRRDLEVTEDEAVLFYSGRMSLQKNISRMLQEVFNFWQRYPMPMKLLMAGPYDDIGAPLFEINYKTGFYFNYLKTILSCFPESFRNCIRYLGNCSSGDLAGLNNAADLYVSYSLHHDEDYGMAPAEALCCGSRAVLTDWGGFSSFEDQDGVCRLIPVRISKRGLEISKSSSPQIITNQLVMSKLDNRAENANRFQNRLSVSAASKVLKNLLDRPPGRFRGFSPLLKKYDRTYAVGSPYFDGLSTGTFYEEIYDTYAKS